MCHYVIFYEIPSGCVESPKHIVETKFYFTCDDIANNPEEEKEHCDDEECESIGEMGSSRVISDCSECIANILDEPMMVIMGVGSAF